MTQPEIIAIAVLMVAGVAQRLDESGTPNPLQRYHSEGRLVGISAGAAVDMTVTLGGTNFVLGAIPAGYAPVDLPIDTVQGIDLLSNAGGVVTLYLQLHRRKR